MGHERDRQIQELQRRQGQAQALEEAKLTTTAQEFGAVGGQIRQDIAGQRGIVQEGFDPFVQAGQGALQDVTRGATFAGRGQNLQDIINDPTFQALRDEQERAARGQFAASGQTGGANALQFLSQISPQLALQLEREQFGRQTGLAGQGLQAVGQSGQLTNPLVLGGAGIGSQLAQQLGLIRTGVGGSQARGILSSAQLESGVRDKAIKEAAARRKSKFGFIGQLAGVGANIIAPGSGQFVSAGVSGGLEAFG